MDHYWAPDAHGSDRSAPLAGLDFMFDPADGLCSDLDACRVALSGLQCVLRLRAHTCRLAGLGQPPSTNGGRHRRPPTGPELLAPPKRARRRRRVRACVQSSGSNIWRLPRERKAVAGWALQRKVRKSCANHCATSDRNQPIPRPRKGRFCGNRPMSILLNNSPPGVDCRHSAMYQGRVTRFPSS
jgi:hypothetical protein